MRYDITAQMDMLEIRSKKSIWRNGSTIGGSIIALETIVKSCCRAISYRFPFLLAAPSSCIRGIKVEGDQRITWRRYIYCGGLHEDWDPGPSRLRVETRSLQSLSIGSDGEPLWCLRAIVIPWDTPTILWQHSYVATQSRSSRIFARAHRWHH